MWNNRDDASFPNPIPDILQACRDAVARRLADAGPGTTPRAPEPQPAGSRRAVVNDEVLPEGTVRALERQYGMRIENGEYWYDRISGAWGLRGGPAAGFILPGLTLGGPLRADASSGNTGVFVNGRELHALDVLALQRIVPVVLPGRYWVDAQGNGGYEGGPPLFNLFALAHSARGAQGGPWSHTSKYTGGTVGGDGEGFLYYNGGKTSWSN